MKSRYSLIWKLLALAAEKTDSEEKEKEGSGKKKRVGKSKGNKLATLP